MSYCTQALLLADFTELELIQRTDRAGSGEIDDAIIDRAIARADAVIDGYTPQYPKPLAAVPPLLTDLACDIARYYLFQDVALEDNSMVKRRYDDAIKYLQQVGAGKLSLGLDPPAAPAAAEMIVVAESPPRLFGREPRR